MQLIVQLIQWKFANWDVHANVRLSQASWFKGQTSQATHRWSPKHFWRQSDGPEGEVLRMWSPRASSWDGTLYFSTNDHIVMGPTSGKWGCNPSPNYSNPSMRVEDPTNCGVRKALIERIIRPANQHESPAFTSCSQYSIARLLTLQSRR